MEKLKLRSRKHLEGSNLPQATRARRFLGRPSYEWLGSRFAGAVVTFFFATSVPLFTSAAASELTEMSQQKTAVAKATDQVLRSPLPSISVAGFGKTLQAELYAQTLLPEDAVLGKTKIGGLSGMVWTGEKLVAVSDDRGKHGGPRYYDFELTLSKKKTKLKALRSYPVKIEKKGWVLDLEALVILPSGEYLLSTEGDTNTKPRAMPRLFTLAGGKLKSDLPIPEKFLPEPIGKQRKGIGNNRGFEGVSLSPDGTNLFAAIEAPLVSDTPEIPCTTEWVRIVRFTKPVEADGFSPMAEYAYPIEKLASLKSGPEVFRGISEILAIDSQRLLVLERGARISTEGVGYTSSIYIYEIAGLKDVSSISPLCTSQPVSGKKTLLVNLAEAVKTEGTENFEALSWGPTLPDGRKSLLVLSDNNFSTSEKTQLLVFALREVP